MNRLYRRLRVLEKRRRKHGLNSRILKGQASEENFEQWTTNLMDKGDLPWLRRVRRVGKIEDVTAKTDFQILAIGRNEFGFQKLWIRIQIKSSMTGAQKFYERHPTLDIYVIVMNEQMTPELLHHTLGEIYLQESKLQRPAPATA